MSAERSHHCRSCGCGPLVPFLSLGRMPLAGAFLVAAQLHVTEPTFPLDVAVCDGCGLVQLLTDVRREELFVDNFSYFSSYSEIVLDHASKHADNLIRERALGERSLVVELGSNDGYLLRNFVDRGVRTLGVDPAHDQVAAAEALGVRTVQEFFGLDVARSIRAEHGPADVIIANNVLAHVPALNDFVAGMAVLLADDGVITVENPYVRDLLDGVAFDTIYHEHYYYYSCHSLSMLVRRHGLFLNHVEYFPALHGGTLRWHISRNEGVSAQCAGYLYNEQIQGLASPTRYTDFAERVANVRLELKDLLTTLRAQGATIAAYGAAAKGSTLLNHVGIGPDLVDFVVDRNVHKHGRFMPGVRIPIRPVTDLLDRQPDYCLLLAWNFAAEIMRQQATYRSRGGRFITPTPTPEVI